VRKGRQSPKVGNLIMNQLKKRENFEVTLIDPLEYDIPLTETRKFKTYIIKKKTSISLFKTR